MSEKSVAHTGKKPGVSEANGFREAKTTETIFTVFRDAHIFYTDKGE
jgi:hypothetical protein